jgi:uncharacterized protein (TIGR03437 family)
VLALSRTRSLLLAGTFVTASVATLALAQDLAVTSAASYHETVSAQSLAAVFGNEFANEQLVASLGQGGELPITLGGVSASFGAKASRILFVSPSQINLLVPAELASGNLVVEVKTAGGSVIRGNAQIKLTSPAIFSLDASGAGPGAVLNAVTGQGGPFRVVTQEIPGSDRRTRIAIFGTGIRHSREIRVSATAVGMAPLPLDIEFFGAAPGFFGLDQVNAVLSPELDGAGLVAVQLTSDDVPSNTVSVEITTVDPADRPTAPQPVFDRFVTSAQVLTNCAVIPGQPGMPCIAFALDHSWTASTSPNGIARYELNSALGNQVSLPATVTAFTEWRVDFGGLACSPEPVGQTFSWNVRAVDSLGNPSEPSRFGIFEIGPCPD